MLGNFWVDFLILFENVTSVFYYLRSAWWWKICYSMIQVFSPSLHWEREGRGGMGKLWSARLWVHLFFPFSPNPSFQWEEGKFVDWDCHRGYEGPLGKVTLKFRIFEQALPLRLFEKISNSLILEEKFTPHLVSPPTHKVRRGRRGGWIFEQALPPLTNHGMAFRIIPS